MYLLINHEEEIQTAIDVLFKFFEYDWSEYIVTIFGLFKLEDINDDLVKLEEKYLEIINSEENTFKGYRMKEHFQILKKHRQEYKTLAEKYGPKILKTSNTPLCHFNIIDPLNSSNNLGKSISNFNSKRIKRIVLKQRHKW